MTEEEVLKRRFWIIKNIEWFIDEAQFHRENASFFLNEKSTVWYWDAEEGKVRIP